MKFNKWCDDNGIIRHSCRYPSAFGPTGQLIGLSATRRIGTKEPFVYVPMKVCINED